MKKLTVGLSFSLFLVVALLTVTLFFAMEDVKAAPTTVTYVTEMYSCNLVSGHSCTERHVPLYGSRRIGVAYTF